MLRREQLACCRTTDVTAERMNCHFAKNNNFHSEKRTAVMNNIWPAAVLNIGGLTRSKHICHAAEEQLLLLQGENSHNCHDDELSCSRHICHAVWRFLRPICMCVKAGRDILSRRCIWHGGDWRRATRRRSKIFPYLPIGGGGEGEGGEGSADMQAGFHFRPWIITLFYLYTRMLI